MDEAPVQSQPARDVDRCTRCLQPVPRNASRCPQCGHPHANRRYVPLLVGVAGIFALAFVMALMYYAAWRADMMKADPLVDPNGAEKQEIMVETPADTKASSEPAKPEKPPPLNEK
jgi:ribosomal protein S14